MGDSAEVLGSEVLRFEVLSEFSGPDISEGAFAFEGVGVVTLNAAEVMPTVLSAPSGATVVLETARVRPASYFIPCAATVTLRAGAFRLANWAPAGSSTVTLRGVGVVPSDLLADGSTALDLRTEALKDAAFAMAGTSTVDLPSGAIAGSRVQIAGTTEAIFRMARVIPCDFNSENIARFNPDGLALVGLIPINPDDMARSAEFRKMAVLPDNRRMQVPAVLRMDRPTENRRMERV